MNNRMHPENVEARTFQALRSLADNARGGLSHNTAPRRLLTDSDPIGVRVYVSPHGTLGGRLLYAAGDYAWIMWDKREVPATTYIEGLWTDADIVLTKKGPQ